MSVETRIANAKKQPKIEFEWESLFASSEGGCARDERGPVENRALVRLRKALRRERMLGQAGHRAYSLVRHMTLTRQLRALER